MNPADDDPVEAIMAECLNRNEADWPAALAAACARHPELAASLRTRFKRLHGLGLTDASVGDLRLTGQQIGDYEVLGCLGVGTSATVVRARHQTSGAIVALKLLRDHLDGAGRWRERFERELRLAEGLRHPGLCRVLAWGEHAGQPFLVMSLVEGRTLAAEIADGSLTPTAVTRRVAVLMQVARALHCMHRSGLVHRDAKPSNVIVRADGSAVLMDLGLAFAEDEGHTLTASNVLPGSPAYFAPELVQGSSRGSIGSDVYAVGVMLHECVTGSLPFEGPTRAALFQQILVGKRRVMAGDAALRRIANTAMARQPRDRYQSAEDLACDLSRYLNGQRPLAQGPGAWRTLTNWVIRNQMAAVIILALGIGGAIAAIAFERTQSALANMRVLALTLAAGEAIHDNVDLALLLANAAHQRQASSQSRSLLYEGLARRHAWRPLPVAELPAPELPAPAMAAGGAVIAAVATSPVGIRVEARPGEHAVRVWRDSSNQFDVVRHPSAVHSVAVSPSGSMLATGGGDGVLRLYELHPEGLQLVAELHGHRGLIRAVAFAAGGNELLTLSDDGTARSWQTQAMLPRWRHPLGKALSSGVAVPDGLLLLGRDRTACVVDVADRPCTPPWLRPRGLLDCSRRFLLQGSEEDPGIVDLARGVRRSWQLGARPVRLAAAVSGGEQLFTSDGTHIDRWNLRGGAFVFAGPLATVAVEVTALAVSDDGKRIACGSSTGEVFVFAGDGQLLAKRQLHRAKERVWSVRFREDGQQLLTASQDETAWCGSLDLLDGVVLQHSGTVLCASYSSGKRGLIATGCVDGVVRLWDHDGVPVAVLRAHRDQIADVTFSEDGRSLLSVCEDGSVRSWPVDDASLLLLVAELPFASVPIPARLERLLQGR